jgi:hypothetical protein
LAAATSAIEHTPTTDLEHCALVFGVCELGRGDVGIQLDEAVSTPVR